MAESTGAARPGAATSSPLLERPGGIVLIRVTVEIRSMPVVTIEMAAGRTLDQKRRVVEEFTNTLVSVLGVDPAEITVLVHEIGRDSIAKAGVLLSER